jgi:hypothetical protein
MHPRCKKVLAWGAGWLLCGLPLLAAQNALIVVGMTGSPSITTDLVDVAQEIQDGLVKRGFAPNAVEILKSQSPDDKITADRIIQNLKKRQALQPQDEFWLILLGFAGRSGEGAHTFQVSGPRLVDTDLKTALDAIPARQFVFIGTSDSGGFVPVLLSKTRSVLAATREEGEIDLPRFPKAWADALKENPNAGWEEIAARAAVLTDKALSDESLAVGEHARLGDPETGQVLEAPFGVDAVAKPAEKPESSGSMALINAADIKVEIHKPNSEWENQPATAETKKLIAEARATPNPEGFNSILLEQRLGYRVGEDRTAENFVMNRIYIAKEDGVARWANFLLPQDPPAEVTKLEAARIIQPDGSSTVFNPDKMPKITDPGTSSALSMIFMPGTHAGCLIEIAYRTKYLLDVTLPEFSQELPVQQDIPAMQTELQLQIPEKMGLHYKLRNTDAKPVETVADGMRTITWKMSTLPAYEALPFDPPARDFVTMLDVSSLESWDAFAAWYRRLSAGSDAQDADVKAKADELAAGAKSRMDKIRKAFEFVSALRYVALEFGINGIRPRTPAVVLQNRYGDCKDKANLLIALLADMGVDGQFCVLNRGSSTDVTFPSWQFNHAIAYVPKAPEAGQPDDLWLDTTDSTAPFPTLSPGDIGRAALVFDKDSAHFQTVVAAGKEMTDITENWKFKQHAPGATGNLDGTLDITWTGLAEYDVRSLVRGSSPHQRDYSLQMRLMSQLRDANFSAIDLTPADDLSQPMQLQAQVDVPRSPNPNPSFAVDEYFAPPQRDRPLLINNGQKLHLIQTVEMPGDAASHTAPAFDRTVAGIHATIAWKSAGTSLIRTAELTIDQPLVAQADYVAVRNMLRNWTQELSP